jgi:hypothetical protein
MLAALASESGQVGRGRPQVGERRKTSSPLKQVGLAGARTRFRAGRRRAHDQIADSVSAGVSDRQGTARLVERLLTHKYDAAAARTRTT